MCRVVDTLLIDQKAVYAPCLGNDRLLMGLNGSLGNSHTAGRAVFHQSRSIRRS